MIIFFNVRLYSMYFLEGWRQGKGEQAEEDGTIRGNIDINLPVVFNLNRPYHPMEALDLTTVQCCSHVLVSVGRSGSR